MGLSASNTSAEQKFLAFLAFLGFLAFLALTLLCPIPASSSLCTTLICTAGRDGIQFRVPGCVMRVNSRHSRLNLKRRPWSRAAMGSLVECTAREDARPASQLGTRLRGRSRFGAAKARNSELGTASAPVKPGHARSCPVMLSQTWSNPVQSSQAWSNLVRPSPAQSSPVRLSKPCASIRRARNAIDGHSQGAQGFCNFIQSL